MQKNESQSDQLEIHSEQIQDIFDYSPNWIIRWGIAIASLFFVVLIIFSWLIKYPDVITADITITSLPAPLPLVSRTNGNLVILKKENDPVKTGETVGFIKSTTNYHDLLLLEQFLLKPESNTNHDLAIGELQEDLAAWLVTLEDLRLFKENDILFKQVANTERQISIYKKMLKSTRYQHAISNEELTLAHSSFKRDSLLYKQNVISHLQYEEASLTYLQKKRANRDFEVSLENYEIQVALLEKQVLELRAQKNEQEHKLIKSIEYAKNNLRSKILKWKESNLLVAPVDGNVAYLGFIQNEMYVKAGQEIFSIVPHEDSLFALAELPIRSSGKVLTGQRVVMRLDNYPFEQFGVIYGNIAQISALPSENKYIVKINIDNGLLTSHKITLPFKQQLKGKTDIITEDLRLLERMFFTLRRLVREN